MISQRTSVLNFIFPPTQLRSDSVSVRDLIQRYVEIG